jgi:uncharacterized membrane protein YphA (DoxX/SURF4 family)
MWSSRHHPKEQFAAAPDAAGAYRREFLALALTGPGAWSIDAWLFGPRRLLGSGRRRR